MSQRADTTKWLWCLMAIYVGPPWSPVHSVNVRNPPKNPTTIEAQAKFFQDFFSVQLSPYKIEFGHVCEDPNTWEQRYEKKDFKNHRDMGKVRWGDKKGGYGEHYWDLNHAGHTGDHGSNEYDGGSDDGSYNHDLDHAHDEYDGNDGHSNHDAYDEPSEQSPSYRTEEYDPEKAASYEETGRAKRAHPRIRTERKLVREEETYEEEPKVKPLKLKRKLKETLQASPTQQVEKVANVSTDLVEEPPKRKRQQRRPQHHHENTNNSEQEKIQNDPPKEEPQHKEPQQTQYYAERQQEKAFVPYEQGAGVRQHHQPQIKAAASVPRLFLEPLTGHVVDRATGQAYVLQPIAVNNYN